MRAMDRLTKKDVNGGNIIFTHDEWCYDPKDDVLTVRGSIADKLAAYEDTGLTPEEIEQLKADNARLHKLVDNIECVMRGACVE